MTTYHTSHIEVLSGCISQACDTRHTDISSYDVRDLLIRLRFNLHNVPLCCLAVASQGGQGCDRSTVYGQQPLLPGPTAQMPAAIIGRTASATSPAVTTVPGRHDRARPSRLCPAVTTEPGRHDCAPRPGTHVAVAMANVHSSVTRRRLFCAGSVCQQVNRHG